LLAVFSGAAVFLSDDDMANGLSMPAASLNVLPNTEGQVQRNLLFLLGDALG
jgi:hypothetical protein